MVAWRRDIHQNPELSGQEVRTAKLVADHLRKLGMDVKTGVGGHGVVGLLKGDLPGIEVSFGTAFGGNSYSVTNNPAALTEASLPVLRAATGGKAVVIPKVSGSEEFSEFQKVAPGFFFILGATPQGKTAAEAAPNHSPAFDFDEDAMAVGANALGALALDSLARK